MVFKKNYLSNVVGVSVHDLINYRSEGTAIEVRHTNFYPFTHLVKVRGGEESCYLQRHETKPRIAWEERQERRARIGKPFMLTGFVVYDEGFPDGFIVSDGSPNEWAPKGVHPSRLITSWFYTHDGKTRPVSGNGEWGWACVVQNPEKIT